MIRWWWNPFARILESIRDLKAITSGGFLLMSQQGDQLTAALAALKGSQDAESAAIQNLTDAVTALTTASNKFEADVITLLQQLANGGVDLTTQIAAVQASQAESDTAKANLATAASALADATTGIVSADAGTQPPGSGPTGTGDGARARAPAP